jgi:hypothetical protein
MPVGAVSNREKSAGSAFYKFFGSYCFKNCLEFGPPLFMADWNLEFNKKGRSLWLQIQSAKCWSLRRPQNGQLNIRARSITSVPRDAKRHLSKIQKNI